MRGWGFTVAAVAVVPITLAASQVDAARLTVTASRTEALYSQTDEPDCTDLSKRGTPGNPDLPFHVVRLSVDSPVTDGSVRYQWSEPSPAAGVFAADLDLGGDDQTRLIRSLCTELGNACVLTGEALALYDRPTILWVAPTCDKLPDDTTRAFPGDRVRFDVRAFRGKQRAGKGSVTVGYGRLASATMLVADGPYQDFRNGNGKPDGEKIFINPAFGAIVDRKGQEIPAATEFSFDTGGAGDVSDTSPCEEFPGAGLEACVFSPLYDSGGKHTAVLNVNLEDGSALCDKLTVNVRTAPLSFELEVTTQPSPAAFVPGDPVKGNPLLRVRARNTSEPGKGHGIVFVGNVLTCETEAKVSGTTLTRTTKIDLQHCSATVSQACDANSDCQSDRCPTCEVGEVCLSSDHCDGSSLGCVTDRDCEPPRCGFCDPGTTCVKVLPLSSVSIGPGETVDFIDSNVSLINVLTTPAKIKETWTARSFNAGDATTLKRYKIKPRPDVKP